MKLIFILILFSNISFSQTNNATQRTMNFPQQNKTPAKLPARENTWVFILAGQSNMAGRGQVEPADTIPDDRILTINKNGDIIVAKEPLHWYEPTRTGLDCGVSFARTLLKSIPKNITILLLPVAVGGSSISQWLDDSTHRDVKLYTNFTEKVKLAKQYGSLKAILWHQGENEAAADKIGLYPERLAHLFWQFRETAGNRELPVLMGELGSFSENNNLWQWINDFMHAYADKDPFTSVITTSDLKDGGDKVHFDSAGQRTMGERFAEAWLSHFNK